jgi:hypothetical protein
MLTGVLKSLVDPNKNQNVVQKVQKIVMRL